MDKDRNSASDHQIDRALKETFPASDPVQPKRITGTEAPGSDINRKAPRISSEDVQSAAQRTMECPHCHGVGRVVAPDDESD
jgi:hypothetical protein